MLRHGAQWLDWSRWKPGSLEPKQQVLEILTMLGCFVNWNFESRVVCCVCALSNMLTPKLCAKLLWGRCNVSCTSVCGHVPLNLFPIVFLSPYCCAASLSTNCEWHRWWTIPVQNYAFLCLPGRNRFKVTNIQKIWKSNWRADKATCDTWENLYGKPEEEEEGVNTMRDVDQPLDMHLENEPFHVIRLKLSKCLCGAGPLVFQIIATKRCSILEKVDITVTLGGLRMWVDPSLSHRVRLNPPVKTSMSHCTPDVTKPGDQASHQSFAVSTGP